VEREAVERGLADAESAAFAEPEAGLAVHEVRGALRDGARRRLRGSRAGSRPARGLDELSRKRARDEGARAGAALEVALGEQLLESVQHGDARDLELRGEAPGGGKTLPRAQAPLDDRIAVSLVDLAVERFRRGAVDRNDGEDSRRSGSH